MKVLLVEDDLDLGNGVRTALQDQGIDTVWVRRLADALHALATDHSDLVLLDLGLPDGDGMALLRQLQRVQPPTPVLILSARDALEDRLRGLDGGADDYVLKPFELAELVSRVRALARRSFGASQTLEVRGLAAHLPTRRVSVHGQDIELSRSEYELLTALLRSVDRVLTRRTLEDKVLPSRGDSNVLDVHMSNLRRKIGEGWIRTLRGVGYVIDSQPLAGSRPTGRSRGAAP